MANNKYGDIDDLLSGADTAVAEAPARKRRPSPAIGVMTGDSRPTSITDGLKAEKQAAENALKDANERFEKEKSKLLKKLDMAKNKEGSGAPVILTMPVTKQEVTFELQRIDPDLIDVSPENERIQDFLDEISLQDILPSIKKHGQQKPGTLRPSGNGRYELIEGSRRLASAKLVKQQYLALVGDVPDADVRELGVIENKHQDVSPFEKAKAYQRQIENKEFENWTQLGAAKGISSSHISRYKACVELDDLFVRVLPSPSDMPLSFAETIGRLQRKAGEALQAKAKDLLKLRKKGELTDVEDVIKILKSAVRTKSAQPTSKRPVMYKSKNGNQFLKHSVSSKGTTKFELNGVDDDQLQKILVYLKSTLKVSTEEAE